MSEQEVYDLRGTLVRAVIDAVNDSGPLQTVDATPHDGVTHSSVEVALPYGIVSVPPAGAIALLAAVGADPADMMAIAVVHPGARAGGGAPGTAGIADAGGNRMLIVPGGIIDIVAATTINLTVGGTTIAITSAGVTITGNLTVSGVMHGTVEG